MIPFRSDNCEYTAEQMAVLNLAHMTILKKIVHSLVAYGPLRENEYQQLSKSVVDSLNNAWCHDCTAEDLVKLVKARGVSLSLKMGGTLFRGVV